MNFVWVSGEKQGQKEQFVRNQGYQTYYENIIN